MLSGKQRSYLRGQANDLNPIVHIGKGGISQAVIEELDEALYDHELVKIRVLDNALTEVKEAADELAEKSNAEVVQVIGNVCVLFRRNQEEPVYKLP
ncbi:MAG: ribosome assembly RNA-binding protein YhbY [Bacillota bacterium]